MIKQEERVLEYLSEGARDVQRHELQVRELQAVKEHLEEVSARLDKEIGQRLKEQGRKLEQEESLLDRCREYLEAQKVEIQRERQRLEEKTRIRRVNEDVLKLRMELEKAMRDQRLMGMIAENYVKEINKRKQTEEKAEGSARVT